MVRSEREAKGNEERRSVGAEVAVPEIADTWDDVEMFVDDFVDGRGDDAHVGIHIGDRVHTYGRGKILENSSEQGHFSS